jgi:transposase
LWAATESRTIGYGGDAVVASATGLARAMVRAGREELKKGEAVTGSQRRPGGGRKALALVQEGWVEAFERMVAPTTRGDPMSPLRWTCKSTRNLAAELRHEGFVVSHTSVGKKLHELGYSLHALRKNQEGTDHPDRNAQFEHISAMVEDFQARNQPVISVDTKKKELVGNFRNVGREWQPKGWPEEVNVHDFPDDAVGKAIPYGVFDMTRNEAWVSVGRDDDTPAFAVASIRQWWKTMGLPAYPSATELLITADAGGSNGYRTRAWKKELQELADDTGLNIHVCHFPPGTSKWNKIEHRLFCHITQNWRGKPLTSFETVVNLIGRTRTTRGLRVKARLDKKQYPTGVEITKAEMKRLALRKDDFHGDWNYLLEPRRAQ